MAKRKMAKGTCRIIKTRRRGKVKICRLKNGKVKLMGAVKSSGR